MKWHVNGMDSANDIRETVEALAIGGRPAVAVEYEFRSPQWLGPRTILNAYYPGDVSVPPTSTRQGAMPELVAEPYFPDGVPAMERSNRVEQGQCERRPDFGKGG
jgi:hypothetical protein